MIERTLSIIKPDAVKAGNSGLIIARLEKEGFSAEKNDFEKFLEENSYDEVNETLNTDEDADETLEQLLEAIDKLSLSPVSPRYSFGHKAATESITISLKLESSGWPLES